LHACASRKDGSVWCWGINRHGECGDGTLDERRRSPVRVKGVSDAIAVAVGTSHACALRRGGSVWCWGSDEWGELGRSGYDGGTGRIVFDASMIDVVGERRSPVAAAVTGLDAVDEISAAGSTNCVVRKKAVLCWGYGALGELGDGKHTERSHPEPVPGVDDALHVAVGDGHVCAVDASGSVTCWGANLMHRSRQKDDSHGPQRVAGVDAVRVAVGGYSACAIERSGSIACWGLNRNGQLGDGSGAYAKELTRVRW
jgi:alpha-tubulin suppressor-like RCC1 family protein